MALFTTRTFQHHADTVAAVRGDLRRDIERIEADVSLSPIGKQQRIAHAWKAASGLINERIAEFDQQIEQRRGQLVRTVFGPDAEVSPLDFRDACGRADACADDQEATRLYERAVRVGDKAMAKALATVGHERGWGDVVSHYLAHDTTSADAARELADIEAGLADVMVGIAVASAQAPPAQLAHLSEHQIGALLDTAGSTEQSALPTPG